MTKHTIEDLRTLLFDALQRLQDKEHPLDIELALAMKDVAQVIVQSAKVEVDHMRISGGSGSGFIPVQSVDRGAPLLPGQTLVEQTANGSRSTVVLPNGVTVTRHKMGG